MRRSPGAPASSRSSSARRAPPGPPGARGCPRHRAKLAVEEGASIDEAMGGIQPFVHFSRKSAVEAALRAWTSGRLERAMAQLAEAALEARRQSGMAEVIAQRALLALAVNARR